MRRRISCFLVLGILLLFSACGQPGESNREKEPENPTVTESGKGSDDWKPAGLDRPASEDAVSLSSGKVLENLSASGKDSPYYCNLEENLQNTDTDREPILVCRDPVYGITYYVNYGRDYYIYALRDGVSELAVAIPAKDLFCRNGELYFIADSYGLYKFDGIAQGNILKYNPVDGSVELVVEQTATEMIVYPDGICYGYIESVEHRSEDGEEKIYTHKGENFYFSFAEGTSTPFTKGRKKRRWKNYYFQPVLEEKPESDPTVQHLRKLGYTDKLFVVTGLELVDSSRPTEPALKMDESIFDFLVRGWISGDFLYYVNRKIEEGQEHGRSVLMTYNLETGEQEEIIALNSPESISSDFILYHNTLYFGKDLRVSLEDGNRCQPVFADKSQERITAFYTDGEVLFCIRNGKLWRLEEKQAKAVTVLDTADFEAPLPLGSYVYYLYLPGTTE